MSTDKELLETCDINRYCKTNAHEISAPVSKHIFCVEWLTHHVVYDVPGFGPERAYGALSRVFMKHQLVLVPVIHLIPTNQTDITLDISAAIAMVVLIVLACSTARQPSVVAMRSRGSRRSVAGLGTSSMYATLRAVGCCES